MSIKRMVIVAVVAVPLFIMLLFGAFLVAVLEDGDMEPSYEYGLDLSDKVKAYAWLVGDTAAEYGIHEYEKYLLAIMMVETGGEGNDVMQSLGNSDLAEDEKTPGASISAAVAYFAELLQRAAEKGCDLNTVIQAYNYGGEYIDYVADRGGEHSFELSSSYAAMKSGGKMVEYNNPVAVEQNGGWRYNYGNMFYVYLVRQYLASEELPSDIAGKILGEAQKYEGYPYVWGGSNPQTSFDCSGLVQWCYGQAGISMPRTAQEQYDAVQHLELEEAKPGDLVFFTGTYQTQNYITHVGIYAGDGKMIHAGDPIGYSYLDSSYWRVHFVCIGRYKQPVVSGD